MCVWEGGILRECCHFILKEVGEGRLQLTCTYTGLILNGR